MFEKEAEEYAMREDVITENDKVPFDNGYGFQTVSFEDEVKKGFQDGAEFGYNKANEWHYVKYGLPISDKDKYYFVVDKWNEPMIARFYCGKWSNHSVIDDVIAWKEIVLPKES